MRAIVVTKPNAGENLHVSDCAEPRTGPGEILVEVAYCGCNYADIQIAKGEYPHPKTYPLIGGIEFSGRVAALGEGVETCAVGDRIAAVAEGGGAFAEKCVVPARRAVKLPDAISLRTGAAVMIQAFTAWHMLHNVSTAREGETVLVHAIGGGVGLYLTQLAVRAGVRVIGTVGTAGKEQRPIEYGASCILNRCDGDFVQAVLSFTGGREVDKVYDSTGGAILDKSFDVVRRLGHVVSIGEAAGRPFPNLWERLVARSLTFSRMHLGHIEFSGQTWQASCEDIFGGVGDGWLKVPMEGVAPLEKAAEMLKRLESRQVAGKLLLSVSPEA